MVVLVISLMEFIWLPNILEATLNNKINQFQYVLQVSSRLADTLPSDQQRTALLEKMNVQAHQQSQGWQNIVFAPEQDLRQEAQSDMQLQLLLQRLPLSNYAYGLWFSPTQVLSEQRTIYRVFELLIITFFSLVMFFIWRRRAISLDCLEQLTAAARALEKGDLAQPFPRFFPRSRLAELIDSLEITRHSLQALQSKIDDKVAAKKIIEHNFQVLLATKKVLEQRLHNSHKVANVGSWEWSGAENRMWYSVSLIEILGLKEENQNDSVETFLQQVHSSDKKILLTQFRSQLQVGAEICSKFRISLEGNIKHLCLTAKVHRKKDGGLKLVGTCQDVSALKEVESLLKKFTSAITASNYGVMITDVIGTVEYINPKYTQSSGFEKMALVGAPAVMLSRDCLTEKQYDSMWKDILAGKSWRGDLENIRKDGSFYWSNVVISPIYNDYDELTHFVILVEDISELKDAKEKVKQLALYDGLTGLPNRRLFYSELKRLFRADVIDAPAVVMLFDLDNFKSINDAQGHSVGDKLLIAVASRLTQNLPEGAIIARLGGDEFAMLINPVKNVMEVERIAKHLLGIIAQPYIIEGYAIQINTSIGLAWLPKDGNLPDVILKNADLAMYQAKEMGRNQYRHFTEQLNEQVQRYIRFSKEMPEALRQGQFILNFQPKVDLQAQKIIGVEALVRWEHPELGIVPPVDFISIAEDTGFIVPLGNWVFAEACRNMKKLRELGYADISCAINISLRQFRDPSLLGVMAKSMRDNDIEPNLLEVEITESLLMEDVDTAIHTLNKIQQLGLSVAIDDFGTGFSSFAYLKNLPIDVLKVDRTFIKDIPESEGDMKITSAIISMAHSLNLKVVAEGIETNSQRQFLLEQGCDIGQGYLFGKPLPIDQLTEVLGRH